MKIFKHKSTLVKFGFIAGIVLLIEGLMFVPWRNFFYPSLDIKSPAISSSAVPCLVDTSMGFDFEKYSSFEDYFFELNNLCDMNPEICRMQFDRYTYVVGGG